MKFNRNLLVLSLLVAAAACLGWSKVPSPEGGLLSGTWECKSHGTPDGDTDFTLTLEQDGEKVTGSIQADRGGTDISSATFKANVLEIHLDTVQGDYVLTAMLKDGRLTDGVVTLDGKKFGTWEGKKGSK